MLRLWPNFLRLGVIHVYDDEMSELQENFEAEIGSGFRKENGMPAVPRTIHG